MLTKLRNRTRPGSILWLSVMWILLMGELTWGNVFAAVALAVAIVMFFPLPPVPSGGINLDVWALLKYIIRWIGSLITAALSVSWLAIRPADPPRSAILTVPMRLSSELELYFATCAYNLQPGGCVTDIDLANRTWTIHVLDAGTDAAVDKAIADVAALERAMIEIFEKPKHKITVKKGARRHG